MKTEDSSYRLLGVDPGTNILGYAILDIKGRKMALCDMGVIYPGKFNTHQEKLQHIFERLQSIVDIYQPREMAIEAPFYAKNPQSMLKLAGRRGLPLLPR